MAASCQGGRRNQSACEERLRSIISELEYYRETGDVERPYFLRSLPEERARCTGSVAGHGQEHRGNRPRQDGRGACQAARIADQQLRLLSADPSQRVATAGCAAGEARPAGDLA